MQIPGFKVYVLFFPLQIFEQLLNQHFKYPQADHYHQDAGMIQQ